MVSVQVKAIGSALGCLLMLLLPLSVLSGHAAAATWGVELGDEWEYEYAYPFEFAWGEPYTMNLDGTIRFTVTSETNLPVNGTNQKVVMISVSGSGIGRGATPDTPVNETLSISGKVTRLASNFSLVSSDITISLSDKIDGYGGRVIYWNSSTGAHLDFNPPCDDYVGDSDLTSFKSQRSTCAVSMRSWSYDEPLDENTSEIGDSSMMTKTLLIQNHASVTTPAGTFDCNKYAVTQTIDNDSEIRSWYYSQEVGNYIKFDGFWVLGIPFLDVNYTLKSFQHDPPKKGLDIFSGPSMYIAITVTAAIIALVAIAMIAKRKRYRRRGY